MLIRVKHAIVCDDIRREDNGKHIIIGVFGNEIGVFDMPASLALAVVLFVFADEAGGSEITFRWLVDKEVRFETKGHVQIAQAGDAALNFPPVPIMGIEKNATLSFDIMFEGHDWQTAVTLPVVNRSTAPNASQPPA